MSNPLKKPPRPIGGTVTCKLCGAQFTGPAVLMIKPGQTNHEHERLKKFMEELARHTIEKHDGHDSAMQLKAHEYLAMLRLLNFVLHDPELVEQRDYFRWSVHQATLNATISDAAIKGLSAQLAGEIVENALGFFPMIRPEGEKPPYLPDKAAYKNFAAEKIAAVLKGLREELQEPGKFEVSPVLDSKGSEIASLKV